MSYCVNCGVKLEQSLDRCPLCNTPIINPNEVTHTKSVPPFPTEKGQVEMVKNRDWAILLAVSLTATALVCVLLNIFVFPFSRWSLYVVGACMVICVLVLPAILYTRIPIYISVLCDGIAIALYQYMISFNTSSQNWFFGLGLPITALFTAAGLLYVLLIRKVSASLLMRGIYFFSELALLCAGLELLIEHYLQDPGHLTWSAIVLAICAVIVVALITILSRARLRNAVRRRLHF